MTRSWPSGLLRGTLQLGAIQTPGLFDRAAALARFHDLHPAVNIRYVHDTTMNLVPEVAARLDVALVAQPQQLLD